ncbi:MAG: class II glutamine amidotransferase [Gemmatimonadetes bacterium]|nr:MAG: class II glutamine amidotransferase [Gemmatimonadota bacterium]
MCRFLVYYGNETLMADMVTHPAHSLIHQSYHAEELSHPMNADGVGVGWYVPEIDDIPCFITSVSPAWSNQNLKRLAEKIRAKLIFAHVRAASPGLPVTELNCHPFQMGRFLWMHNGVLADFPRIKRRLRASLRDDIYHHIYGTTDSEHAFGLFMNQLEDPRGTYPPDQLQTAMITTIRQLEQWNAEAGIVQGSLLNFAVSDGNTVMVTRYTTDPAVPPASLYYSCGHRFECKEGICQMVPPQGEPHAIIIASEPLTFRADWEVVPPNHMVVVSAAGKMNLISLQ